MIWLRSSGSSAIWCASCLVPGPNGSGRIIVNGLEESLARVMAAGCWSELRSFGAAVSDYTAQGEPDRFQVLCHGERGGQCRVVTDAACTTSSMRWPRSPRPSMWVSTPAMPRRPWRSSATCAGAWSCAAASRLPGALAGAAPVQLYDDFAHHPTAIRTTVDGLAAQGRRVGADSGRVRAAHQHHETRRHEGPAALEPGRGRSGVLPFRRSGLGCRRGAGAAGRQGHGGATTSTRWCAQVLAAVRPGDQILCMSNGGFGGIHQKLIDALQARRRAAPQARSRRLTVGLTPARGQPSPAAAVPAVPSLRARAAPPPLRTGSPAVPANGPSPGRHR